MPRGEWSTLAAGPTVRKRDTFLGQTSVNDLSRNSAAEEVATYKQNLLATGRQYWKTKGDKGEAIWPPHLEAALLKGLEKYQKIAWKPIRDRRCPLRNKFIAEHIEETTGVIRTSRQISSRLQHLKDTCPSQLIVKMITPSDFKPSIAGSSQPNRSPTPRNSSPSSLPDSRPSSRLDRIDGCPEPESQHSPSTIVTPVPLRGFTTSLLQSITNTTRLMTFPTLTENNISPDPIPQAHSSVLDAENSNFDVDVRVDDVSWTIPLIPLTSSRQSDTVQISLGSYENPLAARYGSVCLNTVIQLLAPYPLANRSNFVVYLSGHPTPVYEEVTTLSCTSVAEQSPEWFYMASLVPGFWASLNDTADAENYTVEQSIEPLLQSVSSAGGLVYSQTQQKTSDITIRYRFRIQGSEEATSNHSEKPSPTSSLHFDAQGHLFVHNESLGRVGLVNAEKFDGGSPMAEQHITFHQNQTIISPDMPPHSEVPFLPHIWHRPY